jgi:hypothetical protein
VKLALAALVLGLACAPLHAQHAEKKRTEEKKKASSPGHTVNKQSQPPKRQASRPQQFDPARPQDQRARERVPGDPPPDHRKHTVSRDSQPPKGSPSPASQLQQKRNDDDRRTVQCTARPVCGSGYGRCTSVQQTYRGGTEQSRRQDIVNECIGANTPDTCQCAVQCRRVAQCSIF